jgi:hypothetical protein
MTVQNGPILGFCAFARTGGTQAPNGPFPSIFEILPLVCRRRTSRLHFPISVAAIGVLRLLRRRRHRLGDAHRRSRLLIIIILLLLLMVFSPGKNQPSFVFIAVLLCHRSCAIGDAHVVYILGGITFEAARVLLCV